MRFVRYAQFAIGLAASGGVLVVLSGSALAADAVAVSAPQKTATVKTSSQQQVDQSTATATAAASGTISNNSTLGSNGGVAATGASQASDGEADTAKQSAAATNKTVGQDSALGQSMAAVADSGAEASSTTAQVAGSRQTVPTLGIQESVSTSSAPVIAIAAPESTEAAPEATSWPRATVLPIQPVITAHSAVLVNDLAATVPSAPLPARKPSPTHSNGWLGQLTASLAGTVVPQWLGAVLGAIGAIWAVLPMALSVLGLALTGFVFSYGLWLRRSGFAHAARSDSAAAVFSPFATSLRLGFGRAHRRHQSPFFNDVRDEKWLSMLIERRNTR